MAAAEEQTRLQIGHVLFIDIVGYSKLLVNQQSELLRELNEVVSSANPERTSADRPANGHSQRSG